MSKPQADDLEAVRKVIEALGAFEAKDQERILRWAREKVGLVPQRQEASSSPGVRPDVPQAQQAAGTDIKSFIEQKNPPSEAQFAATVAYYYRFEAPQHLRKDSITAEELQEACRAKSAEIGWLTLPRRW